MSLRIPVDRKKIAALCRRRRIRRLSLFGSVLRDDFRPDSDVDVLVEFAPDQIIGFDILDIERELSDLFGGHKADIVSQKYLNRRLRNHILAEAEPQYAEG
jgi:predicted nucleotidyltransferase